MTDNPLVTILMPSYNHARFVGRALDSAINQTYRNLQIIVVDDGSRDDSVRLIKDYLRDPRVEFLAIENNVGAALASNLGIERARGKYFATLSSDDFWELDKLATQVVILESNSKLAATFGMARLIDERGLPINRPSPFKKLDLGRHEWLNELYYNGNCLCHPSVLMRTELFKTVGLHPGFLASLPDYLLWIKILEIGEIYVSEKILVNFRIMDRELNASGDNPSNRRAALNEWGYIVDRFRSFCNQDDFPKVFRDIDLNLDRENDFEFLFAANATKHRSASVRAYGIRLLYQILDDSERASRIAAWHQFSMMDMIRLAASVDPYQAEELRAVRLQLDEVTAELRGIKNSRAYALMLKLWRLRGFLRTGN